MRIPLAILVVLGSLVAFAPSSPAPWVVGAGTLVTGNGPQNVTADFTEDGQGLVMAWDPPEAGTAPTGYRIYLNGEALTDTTSLTYTHDLSAWNGLARNYQIMVMHGATEGAASVPILLMRFTPVGIDPHCPWVGVALGSEFPFVRPQVYGECLPP